MEDDNFKLSIKALRKEQTTTFPSSPTENAKKGADKEKKEN